MDVLFLCTGNICRSPMAEALLNDRLAEHHLSGRARSAGLLYDGHHASDGAVEALWRWGIDLRGHGSRVMTPEMLHAADLVLGMARMHVREAAVMAPATFPKTFTLKEFARRAEATGPRAGSDMSSWLDEVGAGRRPADLLGDHLDDDVEDPIGRSLAFYEATAHELSDLVDRVLVAVWSPADAAPGGAHGGPGPQPPEAASLGEVG